MVANKIVLSEFKEWVGHLPYMFLLLLSLLSGWRSSRCLAQLKLCQDHQDKRDVAIVQAEMLLLDLPCGYAGLLCLLSGWCSKEAYQIITEGDSHLGREIASFEECSLSHFRLLRLVGRLMTDITMIPFLLMVVLFPWRYKNWQRKISQVLSILFGSDLNRKHNSGTNAESCLKKLQRYLLMR